MYRYRITGVLVLFFCVGCMKLIGPPPEDGVQLVQGQQGSQQFNDEEKLRKELVALRKQDKVAQAERIEQAASNKATAAAKRNVAAQSVYPVVSNIQGRSSPNLMPMNKASTQAVKTQPVAAKAGPELLREQLWIRVPFRTGFTSVDKKLVKPLTDIAGKYLAEPREQTLIVRGFCDAEPIGGYENKKHKSRHGYKSQLALSQSRARAVADVLIKAGVKTEVIQVEGYGSTHFIAGNNTRKGRDRNRRVDVFLIGK